MDPQKTQQIQQAFTNLKQNIANQIDEFDLTLTQLLDSQNDPVQTPATESTVPNPPMAQPTTDSTPTTPATFPSNLVKDEMVQRQQQEAQQKQDETTPTTTPQPTPDLNQVAPTNLNPEVANEPAQPVVEVPQNPETSQQPETTTPTDPANPTPNSNLDPQTL